MKSTWNKYILYAAYILIGGGLLYGLPQIILAGYSVSWTGFGERTLSNGDIVGEKTLWDWMELLIIPLVLALGAFFLNHSERAIERETEEKRAELERETAKDRQRETAFQAYISQMSELLLEKKLRTTKRKEVRDVARTLTITAMRELDKKRNDLIVQFLREANVIIDKHSILNRADMEEMSLGHLNLRNIFLQEVNLGKAHLEQAVLANAHLEGANLHSAQMKGAFLSFAHLEGANFSLSHLERARFGLAHLVETKFTGAYLMKAYFEKANLEKGDLSGANLTGAILDYANLQETNLRHANLQSATFLGANFRGALLEKANLRDAKVTPEQLAQAKSLKGATMPDGTIHE